jgi:hypothetical protein
MMNGHIIQRNEPCPCGSGKRFKHCCGEFDRSGVIQPVKVPPPGVGGDPPYRTRRTFVVLGSPRGGTSLLAGALHRAGVHMGAFKTTQYEDPDFKLPPHQASAAPARLAPTIRSRNLQFEHWGWKVPNNIYYIRTVAGLLINPVFLFIYRDPVEIARSSARHDGRNWDEQRQRLLDVAVTHTRMVREFEATLRTGFHVFQLEMIHGDPAAFVDRFIRLVEPLAVDREGLLRFVDRNGGYH